MQSKIFLHFILWFLAFNQGIFQTFGIPTYTYKVGMPILLLALAVLTFYGKKIKLPFFIPILIFFLVCMFSYLLNRISFFNLIYFLLIVFSPILYFLILINEEKKNYLIELKKLLHFFA